MVELLEGYGVDVVFGYPGGAILPFYDEIYKSKKIKHILVRHEQGAVHMAEGYARATGKLGVCIATSGPGATNLVTGLTDAKMDSVPILAITGQVATNAIGTDAFQEADIFGITIPITKYNALIKSADDIARHFEEATLIALGGRPGPVLLDFPKDVQTELTDVRKAARLKIAPHHYKNRKFAGIWKNLRKRSIDLKSLFFMWRGGDQCGRLQGNLRACNQGTNSGYHNFDGSRFFSRNTSLKCRNARNARNGRREQSGIRM